MQQYQPTEGQQQEPILHTHPIVPPIPPPTAFQMYAEARFLSQPHNHSSKHANTTEALMQLAHETWDTESEGVKQYYLLQESKAKESHEAKVAAAQEYETQQQQQQQQEAVRGGATAKDKAVPSEEREREQAESERMVVDDEGEKTTEAKTGDRASSAAAAGAGGFTSING